MSDSPSQLEENEIQRQLMQRRRNLAYLEQQGASYGVANVPLELHNQIEAEQAAIAELGAELRRRSSATGTPISEAATPIVLQGITALTRLMSDPEVYAAVEVYSDTFQAAREQISALNDFKGLHDLLHQLQFQCYDLLVAAGPHIESELGGWRHLKGPQRELRRIASELEEIARHASFSGDIDEGIGNVGQASHDLSLALTETDASRLQDVIWQLKRVIDRQPSFINLQLHETARNLSRSGIGQKMQRLLDRLRQLNLDQPLLDQFDEGVVALQVLGQQLTTLVDNHNDWQLIDRELRWIDALLEHGTRELERSWLRLRARVEPLCIDSGEEWVVALQACTEELDGALRAMDVAAIEMLFHDYCREICYRFFQVDKSLLRLCNELGAFRNSLAELQRMLG